MAFEFFNKFEKGGVTLNPKILNNGMVKYTKIRKINVLYFILKDKSNKKQIRGDAH